MSTPAAADLAPIRALVARARTRLRLQGALEGAVTSSILASAGALTAVFLVRTETIAPATGIGLIAAAGGVIGVGAVLGALGHLDDEQIARRIDRASGLSDRLSSAVAFERVLASGPTSDHEETEALMRAAMRDAAAVAPRADVKAATPIRRPADLPVAGAFAAIALIASLLGVVIPPRLPVVSVADPSMAKRGVQVAILGERLCGPDARAALACTVPSAMVYVGDDDGAIAAPIDAWTGGKILVTIPRTAKVGPTQLVVWGRGKKIGAVPFEVLDDKDPRAGTPTTVALDPDDEAYMRDLVAGLRDTARRDKVKELDEYAAKIEKLLDLADNGELTKEQLLQKMQEAQAELDAKMEQKPEEIQKDLAETGQELKKNELTKELGAALEKGDLDQAKAEMEKLAEKLAKGELTQQQAQQLAKTLEQAAEQYEQAQEAKQAKQDQTQEKKVQEELAALQKERDQAKTPEERAEAEQKLARKQDELDKLEQKQAQRDRREKLEEEIRKLEKKKQQAKTPQEQEELDRQLDKKKDELAQLQKQQEQEDKQDESNQREALKRLHKDMDKVAQALQQKPEPGQDPNQQNQNNQKQASRDMKNVADETGAVSNDQRKQAAQKKVASQMEDLREAMRRAKQQGKQGQQNPFGKGNKQGQNQDFAKRASGKGKGKQGQGQGQNGQGQQGQGQQGQGQGQNGQGQNGGNGGNGQDPGDPSNTYGDGHDDNLVGDSTDMSGNTADEDLSGAQGRKGPSRRETILAAAQKGYASKAYRQVFADYKAIVEEVMRTEKVPPSYKYYVKKYFTKIKPHSMN